MAGSVAAHRRPAHPEQSQLRLQPLPCTRPVLSITGGLLCYHPRRGGGCGGRAHYGSKRGGAHARLPAPLPPPARARHQQPPRCAVECRKARRKSLHELAVSPGRWLARVRPFVLHRRRRVAQGPYWASVRDELESCNWLNTIIGKMWPVYDHPVCTCAPRPMRCEC